MDIELFNFTLPEERIAQYPCPVRSQSRLLLLPFGNAPLIDASFADLPMQLQAQDLLVFNDTKVLKARLHGKKSSGGKVELLLERFLDATRGLFYLKASHRPKVGDTLDFFHAVHGHHYQARVIGYCDAFVELAWSHALMDVLDNVGTLPLPPYIKHQADALDDQRYQTIFAKHEGAIAAPTASLHFDDTLMQTLQQRGIQHDFLTLHVGAGTFSPVRVQDITQHHMHSEPYVLYPSLIEQIAQTKACGGRVIAVGTTVMRTLESFYRQHKVEESIQNPQHGETNIFIYPGFDFKVVDGLITNFHLPKSSLLMLVAAFIGLERMRSVYDHAIAQSYRFFSYGDAMLCWRNQ